MRHLMSGFLEWPSPFVKTASEMGNGPGLKGGSLAQAAIQKSQRAVLR